MASESNASLLTDGTSAKPVEGSGFPAQEAQGNGNVAIGGERKDNATPDGPTTGKEEAFYDANEDVDDEDDGGGVGEDDDEDEEEEEEEEDQPKKKTGRKKEPKTDIKRIRYSNDFKVKVLDELEVSNVTIAEMARRHKLPEATLRDWVKTKSKITTAQVNRRGSAKSNSRDNLQKVTDALRTFMDLNDRLGACGMSKLPITNAMIAKQGQEVKGLLLEKDAKKPFLSAQERKTLNAFNASIWWSKKWARKHNLHSVGHREAAKAAAALSSKVPEIRKEYSNERVFFVVDTMLFYKVLPTLSYAEKGTPGISPAGGAPKKYLGLLKDRVSLFICSNSSGTHKIPLTMLSDTKDPPSFLAERQKLFPYIYQKESWCDPKSLLQWWKDIFLPNIRAWTDEKVLLVLQKPSIVDLEDPQEQVNVKFLPPLLANNHNSTEDGLSVSSFFEPPMNMLSVVKTKYRYELLKEVFSVFEERDKRREVAEKANLALPGLKQGELPHLQDCMRILNTVWNDLPPSMISSSEDGDGKKKKRRRRRKKKGDDENDTIENDVIAYTDEMGTDELIKDIVQFFRKNSDDINSNPNGNKEGSLEKSVTEVQNCFLNSSMQLKTNQDQIRKVLEKWIGLEESQEIRAMLQSEILAGMKFRLIIGVDDVEEDDDDDDKEKNNGSATEGDVETSNGEKIEINEDVAMDCATQLLQCAVRLSKEHPAFHSLASQLMEASDSAFVALREAKNPTPPKVEPTVPKKRKPRVSTGPRKKRSTVDDKVPEGTEKQSEEKEDSPMLPTANALVGDDKPSDIDAAVPVGANPAETYDGTVFEI